jgi:ubiquinone biosynthesis protein COQ9
MPHLSHLADRLIFWDGPGVNKKQYCNNKGVVSGIYISTQIKLAQQPVGHFLFFFFAFNTLFSP